MNKDKLKEIIKKLRSGTLKLKDLSPKIQLQIVMDKLMAKLKIFLIQLGSWVVLGCLIIGALLLCLAGLLELFKAIADFFGAVWNGIQYVFMGTKAEVDPQDIEDVRNKIAEMGVDFDEIGYIGAINLIGRSRRF